MKKVTIILLLNFSLFGKIFCQSNFNKQWLTGVGYSYKINFLTTGVDNISYFDTSNYVKCGFTMASSNICDAQGKLILCSNGYNVLDSNRNYVDGLDSIGGRDLIHHDQLAAYGQTGLFLPIDSGIYYYVSGTASNMEFYKWYNLAAHDPIFDELLYCKIDMKGNGGLGKCTQREVKILENETLSKTQMMACKHANGKDWWLFKQARGLNKVFKFLFTQDSVINYGTQSFPEPIFSSFDQGGQSMFSQQGDRYATTCRGTKKIFVSDFNRCSGNLSNPKVYDLPELNAHSPFDSTMKDIYSEGLVFSPNGRFIYVYMYFNIQQLDLWDSNIATQWSVVAELDTTWDNFNSYSISYLGYDNKLYIGNWGGLSAEMSYFSNPDIKGLGSNFCKRCLVFPKNGVNTPPNMPNYDLGLDSSLCWPLVINQEELPVVNDLEVYPNPSSFIFYFKNKKGKKKDLFNSVGQLIISTTNEEINVATLQSGLYYIRCEGQTKKVIVE